MQQSRIAATIALGGVGAHSAYVATERSKAKPRTFSPGSEDARLADTLNTGDVLLFSRPCDLYFCFGAVLCAVRKLRGGSNFDHCGVVIVQNGTPFVLERTYSSVQFRQYDHRILCSRSKEIIVRRPEHAQIDADKVASFISNINTDSGSKAASIGTLAGELFLGGTNGSVALVQDFFCAVLTREPERKHRRVDVSIAALAGGARDITFDDGRYVRFGRPHWIRDLL